MNLVRLNELKLHRSYDPFRPHDFYLSATYTVETDVEVRELHIPKMYLPLDSRSLAISHSLNGSAAIEMCDSKLVILDPAKIQERIIKTKTKKMTLKEIEKKLGHKIELISEEE